MLAFKGAVLDDSGLFRYALHRQFGTLFARDKSRCLFVMLNPSTADAEDDDPTITRCIGFSEGWEYSSLAVGNLFAFRSTDQKGLLTADDPVGPENDVYLEALARVSDVIVCAWGSGKTPAVTKLIERRMPKVLSILRAHGTPLCLGTTDGGFPRHPLYLARDTGLRPFSERSAASSL